MSSRDAALLAPDVRARWDQHRLDAKAQGIVLALTCTLRTLVEQAAEYAKGRTTAGVPCLHRGDARRRVVGTCPVHPLGATVTAAPPGYSWHNYGRAYDVAITYFPGDLAPSDVYDGPWGVVGSLGEAAGMEWGGRWKRGDTPHFEHHGGLTLAQARGSGA